MSETPTVAVVGMSCRVPGAGSANDFWADIAASIERVQRYTDDELTEAGVNPSELALPNYVPYGAPLEDFERFDAEFFGLGPKDAAIMDPQHRALLEVAWETLEHAGHMPERFDGDIGVFAGCGMNAYMMFNLLTNPALVDQVGMFLLRHTGNDKDFLATRLSYALDLTGPSVNVQTACSTSLVAIHQAAQSLLSGECDLALAGGVTIELPHRVGYRYADGEILAPDGKCRPFDERARGTIFGSGAGMVALRRTEDAIADGDLIHAIVRGSAINNDGANKVGYLAPSVDGQAACVAEAIAVADVDPASIHYVEAHGTGTAMGDPIEVAALNEAFGMAGGPGSIALGSVKSNIGHLDTAAGVASFIKVIMAMRHGQLPPSLNYSSPNPNIDFASGPFYVNNELRAWPRGATPRRASVNSLGVGGTNAHVVVEEPAGGRQSGSGRRAQLLLLSGRNLEAVTENTRRLASHLRNSDADLADVAYTLQRSRRGFAVRRSVVATSTNDAIARLASDDTALLPTRRMLDRGAHVGFLFPGGGAQYPAMARGLYETEPLFRRLIDEGLDLARTAHGLDLEPYLFPDRDDLESAAEALHRPSLQLPAIFIVEYALAQVWMSWGVEPGSLAGHSMGENTAACVAGVMSFADCLSLVVLRGQLFEEVPAGGMLSVAAAAADLETELPAELVIASRNAPTLTVVSGPNEPLAAYRRKLQKEGVDAREVPIDIAAHSPMLDPILDRFKAHLETLELHEPQIPVASNLTGTWLTAEQATSPQYWVDHLRSCVRFQDCLELLLKDEQLALLEVGPGRTLSSFARQHPNFQAGRPVHNSLRHPDEDTDDDAYMLDVLGRLWAAGLDFDVEAFYAGQDRLHVELPTYAFQRQRYFIEPGQRIGAVEDDDDLVRSDDLADWFHRYDWRQEAPPRSSPSTGTRWLVFLDAAGVGERLVARLRARREAVITVEMGDRFLRRGPSSFVVAPEAGKRGYEALYAALADDDLIPDKVVHLWSVTTDRRVRPGSGWFHHLQERGFFSLLYLAQVASEFNPDTDQRWTVVTNGVLPVAGADVLYPEKATLLGPASVIPAEFAHIDVTTIDIDLPVVEEARGLPTLGSLMGRLGPVPDSDPVAPLLDYLEADLAPSTDGHVIGYRDGRRFRRTFERMRSTDQRQAPLLSENATYLITGGLGGIGLTLAEGLARDWHAKVVLVSRTAMPNRTDWESWLADHGPDERTSRRIRRLLALEDLGGEVLVLQADVASLTDMQEVLEATRARFGSVDGVIHAAGVLEQDLIAFKSDEDIDRVLTPKVQGALVLDRVFAEVELDFMVLMSSTSTFLGAAGQVDYAAANSFLDALAQHRNDVMGRPTISLGWAAWTEVGMAADAADAGIDRNYELSEHPLVDFLSRSDGEAVGVVELAADRLWMLDEHRADNGRAVLPGTAHIEAMLAVASVDAAAVSLANLTFESPLLVADGAIRDARIRLEDGEILIESATQTSSAGWQRHSSASVLAAPERPSALDLAAITARCARLELPVGDDTSVVTTQEDHLRFGPRWRCLRSVAWGDGEALASLSLDAAYRADVEAGLSVHPALLDLATGFGLPLLDDYGTGSPLYVPLSYERIDWFAPLPDEVHSHLRCRETSGTAIARFDITITDADGNVLVDIENFAVVKINPEQSFGGETQSAAAIDVGHLSPAEAAFRRMLEKGIRPDEGWDVFVRALSLALPSHAFVSPMRMGQMLEVVHATRQVDTGARFERPSLETAYRAPENDTERALAEIWSDLLGVDDVGIQDDFFDLGGHSLIAVRMFNSIKKRFGVDYPMSVLFESPTIEKLAARIAEETGVETTTPAIADGAELAPMRHVVHMAGDVGRGRPFFLVAGMFGNVLNLRHFALLLGHDRPVYGIQALGLVEGEQPHDDFTVMASAYIDEIRQVQPEGPYLLGGFSGGGITAWDMARQLTEAGEEVAMVVMLDTPVAQRGDMNLEDKLLYHGQRLRSRGVGYFGDFVRDRLEWERAKRRNSGVPTTAADQRTAAIEGAFYRALAKYETKPWPGDVYLYRPPLTTTYRIGRGRYVNADRELQFEDNGWTPFVRGDLTVTEVPGDHDSMVLEPNVRVLASKVVADMAAVEANLEPTSADS